MIEIIPAIDVIGGRCVRLTCGDYDRSVTYAWDPLEPALRLQDAGCRRLHLVDLDGARSQHVVNHRVLERIASHTGLEIDFGGGIKSDDDLRIAFESGASMVTGGSVAVREPAVFLGWLERYGADRIILGADARDGMIATGGWLDSSDISAEIFVADYSAKGVNKVISTDVSADGTLAGPSVELYRRIVAAAPSVTLIASGGVGCMSDIELLEREGIPAVIVGKAIYEGKITMADLERHNLAARC